MAKAETGWTKEFPTVRIRERHWIRNGEQLVILQVNPSGRHEVIGSSTKYLESDFHGWEFLGPLSPADAEHLVELRKAAQMAHAWIARVSNQYILGVDDPHSHCSRPPALSDRRSLRESLHRVK